MTTIWIIGGVVVLVIGWLAYTGTLGQWIGLGKVKTQDATNKASTAVEKARMRINQLTPLLESMGQQMTDLDGKFGRANGELTRAKAGLEKAKGELKDVLNVIAQQKGITFEEAKTSTDLTADQSSTRSKKIAAVAAAKGLVDAKQAEINGISEQATKLHEQYADAESQLNEQKAALPSLEARQIVIGSKQTAVEFANKMKAFNDAATSGADVNADLDEAEAKADAELGRAGAVKSDTEKAAEAARKAAKEADVLKDL